MRMTEYDGYDDEDDYDVDEDDHNHRTTYNNGNKQTATAAPAPPATVMAATVREVTKITIYTQKNNSSFTGKIFDFLMFKM